MALAGVLAVRALAGHLMLPLIFTVRGLPFLGLLLLRPGEATVLIAGAQVRDGELAVLAAVAAAVAGAVTADVLGYLAGRLWGAAALARLSHHRAGRALGRAERLLRERGTLAVVAARPTVVTHGLVPVLAGTAAMPLRRFVPASMAGALTWSAGWLTGGAGLSAAWSVLPTPARVAVAAVVGAAVVGYVAACLLRRSCPQPLRRHAGAI